MALEYTQEKLAAAMERLNQGMKRKTRKVLRKMKGKELPEDYREPDSCDIDSNWSEESYYVQLEEAPTPIRQQSSVEELDITNRKRGGLTMEDLTDEEYLKVMKVLGAIPEEKPVSELLEDETKQKVDDWFQSSPERRMDKTGLQKSVSTSLLQRLKTIKAA